MSDRLSSFLETSGWLVYAGLNLLLWMVLIFGAIAGGGGFTHLPYVVLMFALCASPIPFVRRLNDPFAMLTVMCGVYFLSFGLADAVAMLSPAPREPPGTGLFTAGEAMLLIGTLVQIAGFHAGVRLFGGDRAAGAARDWPRSMLLPIGLVIWIVGCAGNLYMSLVVQPVNSAAAVTAGFSQLGVWNTTGLIFISNYAGPLGIVILAYWWSRWAPRGGSALMIFIICMQLVVGFVVDQKEAALNGPLVILLTRFVTTGRVPMRWLVCAAAGMALIFPVLTAKRIIMTEGLNLNRAQALSRTGEILWRAIAERDVAQKGRKYEQKAQTFLQRATDKGAVEVFAAHIGVDHDYRMGSTLEPLLYVFIPRLVWSDKPGDSSAQLFNREFHMSEDRDTYISPTHIGELYWNFGMVGVITGMTLIGLLLGWVCGRFDQSRQASITGVLVLIVTLYELVVRRGGQIEVEYAVWIRTLALIWLLHLLLAKPAQSLAQAPAPGLQLAGVRGPRFSNLLP
jgi:hypothetical protein